MKVTCISLLLFAGLLLLSCKSDDSTTTESDPTDNGQLAAEPMPWTFLTAGIYHNNATVVIGQDPGSNPNVGVWLDFHDNGTYDYGRYEAKEGTGKWFYDHDNQLLELAPGGDRKPSEWRVMSRDDNLILVGTSKYGNNAQQQRFNRADGLPER